MSYEIERGVPIPPRAVGRRRVSRYPFALLKVGESFLVSDRTLHQVAGAAATVTRRTGRRFSVRSVEGGVRAWRLS